MTTDLLYIFPDELRDRWIAFSLYQNDELSAQMCAKLHLALSYDLRSKVDG